MDLIAENIFEGIYLGLNIVIGFLNYNKMEEVTTKIFGFKVFAYIVEEARGPNSNFNILVWSPLGWLAGTASLK